MHVCTIASPRATMGGPSFESRTPCNAALFHRMTTLGVSSCGQASIGHRTTEVTVIRAKRETRNMGSPVTIFCGVEKTSVHDKAPEHTEPRARGRNGLDCGTAHVRSTCARHCAGSTSDLILVREFECALHEDLVER